MAISTNLISGLSSGFDWRSMIDQLIAIDHRRVDLIVDKKTDYESQLAEWKNVNTMLLSLKTASGALSTESAFNVFSSSTTSSSTTAASSLLTVSTTSTTSPGMYTIEVEQLAKSQKLSSNGYGATGTALTLSEGDILVSGRVVNIASTDTLADIKDKINGVNTGSNPSNVTANIVQYDTNDYRLVLTNDSTGADGISLLNASSNDILGELGLIETASGSYDIKNSITGGAQSDLFISVNNSIEDLLNLGTPQSSTTLLKIKGENGNDSNAIAINLSAHNLNEIVTAINDSKGAANINASVVSETVNGNTYYRLQIDGIDDTDPFSDENNIFQTLGLIQGGVGAVVGDIGSNAMTTNGQVISASTVLVNIDGYLTHNDLDHIDFAGFDTNNDAVSFQFDIETTTTVQELLDAIEDQYGSVTASITGDGEIQVVDNTTDTAPGNLKVDFSTRTITNGDLDFGFTGAAPTSIRDRELAEGLDARIVVDNQTITNSSNTISTVIDGMTLNLVGEEEGTNVTLKIERDLAAIKSKIEDMVDAYNTIMDYINIQFTYDEDTEQVGGILFGDGTLSTIKSELINTITRTITGASSDYNKLAHIGITLDVVDTDEGEYNKLNLVIDDDGADDNDLMDYLETNFDDVRELFIASGSSPYSNLTYISHTDDTEGGAYNVTISQPATRGTTTGSKTLETIADDDEKVTLTDFATGRVATVDLTIGMDINDVVNAINSEFAKEYTEVLAGSGANDETSSTLFSAITGADNGDVITFSGTRRNGLDVSGSYTVDTTETVGDLLEAIEDMYEDEVTVSLDGTGHLIITDKQAGDSNLTFNIDTQTAEITGLDFGTVDVDPTGADGSQEGRYAMTITASKTAEDKLLLTHNTYGTGQQVATKSELGGDDLGLNDATKVWGENVAGTINSLTATGSGQNLVLDSDGNNADGLSISYTGTSAISAEDGVTFTLTLGIGELLDRRLGFITNTSDGYVTYKKTSLGNSIDSFEDQIENMEARLNRKMEVMINRFVAMELSLANIQNQGQWLMAQVSGSFSGWGSL